MIKKIKLFTNSYDESIKVAEIVKQKFLEKGFIISEDDFDLGIAIGGDGSFLGMIRNANFDRSVHYLGINTGTLGFLPDVDPDKIDSMVDNIQKEKYEIDKVGIQETRVHTPKTSDYFYSLNEIVIERHEENYKSPFFANVKVNDTNLETFAGTGILIATPTGSTARNLSCGGCAIDPRNFVLQITPIEAIVSECYGSFAKSLVVAPKSVITIEPIGRSKRCDIAFDSLIRKYEDVEYIDTIMDKKIKVLRFNNYNFIERINKKLVPKKM